ncbi:hypothetical protein [Nocardia asteroides]|uniref:hypothetical protein n=1 Tax=Nocardia asteroides TaxID=1824 RepID=UPI0033E09569
MDILRQLDQLHADATAAVAAATTPPTEPGPAAEPDDMVGPIVLANGMWANRWHMIWRVTEDRDGDRDHPAKYVSVRLDDCRRWAAQQVKDSAP